MERISVSALRAGMVLPILQFGWPAAFATLVEPDAYYVVTTEHPENSMRLSLAHRNPACARVLPLCLTFEARSTPYSVVIMADAAIRGKIWDPRACPDCSSCNKCPPHRTGHTTCPPSFQPRSPTAIRCARGPSARRQSISATTSGLTQRPRKDPRVDPERV